MSKQQYFKRNENDVLYLSDDKLEGRETERKEKILPQSIVKRFDKIIQTKVDTFEFNDNVELTYL